MRPGAPPPASVEVDVVPLTHIFFLSPEKLMPDVMKLFDAGVEAMGMTDWQPIETALRDGTEILLFFPRRSGNFIATGSSDDPAGDGWRETWGHRPWGKASHWQPLPDPPSSQHRSA